MAFRKAEPKQAKLKVSIYGPPGAGKTLSTLLLAEGLAKVDKTRVAYVDTERGTDFYAQRVPDRKVHPEAFDFDAIYTRTLSTVLSEVKALNPKEHGVVVLDSISHLWESAMDAYTGKLTRGETIPMHAWGKIKKPYKELVAFLINAPVHVFILGRQKNTFDTDPRTGEMIKTGVSMRAEGETPYEPHICLRMECVKNGNDSDYLTYVEKDRTGVLSGKTFHNINFGTIAPLLPLLGVEQAVVDDESERLAADGELLDAMEDAKDKEKLDKSTSVLRELQQRYLNAQTAADIDEAAQAVKEKGRYLVDDHKTVLREMHRATSRQVRN
jgi:hypothetical protein